MNVEKTAKNIRTKMTLVTPKKASEWLQKNTNNRNLRDSAVDKLSADMAAGRWTLTHQGIAFNCDGTLLDGQHRLMAIVRSNTSQWMPVTVGLPAESVSAIDDHYKRSVADSLQIVHGVKSPNINRAVAAAAYLAVPGGNASLAYKSRQAQMETYFKHEKAITWALNAFPTTSRGLCKSTILGVIARAYYTQDRARLSQFCKILMDPSESSGSKADHIIFKLRDHLMTKATGGAKGLQDTYLRTERVLASWLNRESISKIYAASGELFPIDSDEKS